MPTTIAAWSTCLALAALPGRGDQAPRRALETLLSDGLGFTSRQIAAIERGEAVTAQLQSSVDHELAIAGVVRIEGTMERTVAVIRDVEHFESGGRFLQRQRLSTPPRVEDFSAFRLAPADLAALRTCRPGRCGVKLDVDGFAAFGALEWTKPDAAARANALAVERALRQVRTYRAEGDGGLPDYADGERPFAVAKEFREMVAGSRPLNLLGRGLIEALIAYPGSLPTGTEDSFYWSVVDLGLKPVFRIHHVLIRRLGEPAALRYVTATRLVYANHYFNTGLEVRGVIDDAAHAGRAHFLITLTLLRLDGLTGFWGRIAKARIRAGSRRAVAEALLATRRRVEAADIDNDGVNDLATERWVR